MTGAPGEIGLTASRLEFDAIAGSAELTANMTGPRPRLTGSLTLAELDVNPYLPAPVERPAPTSGGARPTTSWVAATGCG